MSFYCKISFLKGYPEEKNMDYDPDDSYQDDDSPYEGLIQSPNQYEDELNHKKRKSKKKGVLNELIDTEVVNSGLSSSGSSSSPLLFENNMDLPYVSNHQQYSKSVYAHTTKYSRQLDPNGQQTYSVLPSSNINANRSNHASNYYQSIGKANSQQLTIDPYAINQSHLPAPLSHRSQHSINQKYQQSSPNLNNQDYGMYCVLFFFTFFLFPELKTLVAMATENWKNFW